MKRAKKYSRKAKTKKAARKAKKSSARKKTASKKKAKSKKGKSSNTSKWSKLKAKVKKKAAKAKNAVKKTVKKAIKNTAAKAKSLQKKISCATANAKKAVKQAIKDPRGTAKRACAQAASTVKKGLAWVDNHLEDIAKVGLVVAGVALVVGTGGLALPAAAPALATTMATVATVSGTVATIGGSVTLGAGSLQIRTAIFGKTLDGRALGSDERVDRGVDGAFNIVFGAMNLVGGTQLVNSGSKILAANKTNDVVTTGKNLSPNAIGKFGEEALSEIIGGESQVYYKTSLGGRFVDQLSNGVAYESKVGYTSASKFVREQVQKDAELIAREAIERAEWHFFESPVTGKIGASKTLIDVLQENGIKVIIHK